MSEAKESLHEALSAAIDGEADELELRRVLNAVRDDPELHARWERMHLVGEALRGTSLAVHQRQTAAWRGQAEGAADELPPQSAAGRRWFLRVAGGGIAAAVAVAVAVVLYLGSEETAPAPGANAVAAAPAAPENLAQLPSEQDLRRANAYLLHHAQHTSVAARPAAMPFVNALAAHDNNARMFMQANNHQLRESSSR